MEEHEFDPYLVMNFMFWLQTYCPIFYRTTLNEIQLLKLEQEEIPEYYWNLRQKGLMHWWNWELCARGMPSLN